MILQIILCTSRGIGLYIYTSEVCTKTTQDNEETNKQQRALYSLPDQEQRAPLKSAVT